MATTRDYIKKRPDTVRRFIRAYVEGSHYNLTNPKGAQKVLQKYLAIKDDKSVQESYNEIVAKLTLKVPYPTERGIQLYLDQLKIKNPKAAQAKPSDFTDVSFLKELESSGFIDKIVQIKTRSQRSSRSTLRSSSQAPVFFRDARMNGLNA